MSRIISYPYDDSIKAKDAWVGTDEASRQTKQYTAEALAEYLNISGSISIIGQMTYKYGTTPLNGIGTLAVFGGGPDIVAFSAVVKLTLSNQDISNQRVVEFLDLLVGSDILIAEQGAISTFGYYSIDSYAINATDSNYYDLGVTFKSGNGSMRSDRIYEAQNFVLANDATQSPWNTVPNGISYTAANVGIGTTSPTSELHIATASPEIKIEDTSNLSAKVTLDGTRLAQITQAGTKFTISDEVFGESFFEYDAGSSMNIKIGDTNFANETHIEIDDNTARVLIPNGNVGIGTTSPGAKLHINDGTNVNLKVGNVGGELQIKTTNDADTAYTPMTLRASEYNILNGNVGIGTTSPSQKLEVAGNTLINNSGDGKLYLGSTSDYIGNIGSDIYTYSSGQNIFYAGGSEQLRIKTNGNVGIGTTAPAYKLDVAGSARVDGVLRVGTTAQNGEIKIIDSNGKTFSLNSGNVGNNKFAIEESGTSTRYLVIDGVTSNVGIGTTSPSEKLEVSGKAIIRKSGSATAHGDTDLLVTDATAASSTAAIQILGGNAGFSNLQFSDTDNYSQGAIMYSHTDNYMALKANAAEKMRITSSGNVGIGTTSPSSKLDVNIPLGISNGITIDTNDEVYSIWSNSNLGGLALSANIVGYTTRYDLFLKHSNGNVGIGTSSPGQKLEVDGQVLSDGYRLAAMQTAPATRNSTGTLGEIVIDGNHIYVCYATDSWSRVALETSW